MMIIVSDNTCTGTVVDMVGLDAINSVPVRGCEARRTATASTGGDGWVPPSPETNATTPADVGLLLERILQGSQDPAVAAQLGSAVPVGTGHLELAAPAGTACRRGCPSAPKWRIRRGPPHAITTMPGLFTRGISRSLS